MPAFGATDARPEWDDLPRDVQERIKTLCYAAFFFATAFGVLLILVLSHV